MKNRISPVSHFCAQGRYLGIKKNIKIRDLARKLCEIGIKKIPFSHNVNPGIMLKIVLIKKKPK